MPYVYKPVDLLKRKPWVDGGNCVSLIKKYAPGITGASTLDWREGARVVDSPKLERGTAIATFVNGRYPRLGVGRGNHAAFFLWHVSDGIYVMDQFVAGNRREPIIDQRLLRKLGKNADGTYVDPSNNADAFSVIEK